MFMLFISHVCQILYHRHPLENGVTRGSVSCWNAANIPLSLIVFSRRTTLCNKQKQAHTNKINFQIQIYKNDLITCCMFNCIYLPETGFITRAISFTAASGSSMTHRENVSITASKLFSLKFNVFASMTWKLDTGSLSWGTRNLAMLIMSSLKSIAG